MKRLLPLILAFAACTASARPLCEDEWAGLRFLDFVAAPMSAADEKEWWDIGGRQFGLFAKRYNIAFSGRDGVRPYRRISVDNFWCLLLDEVGL